MEQFMHLIEDYASAKGWKPTTVLQNAADLSGSRWAAWQSGATCSVRTQEKILKYIADNPPAGSAQ